MWSVALLRDCFRVEAHDCGDYSWASHRLIPGLTEPAVAEIVAMRVMAYRCRNRPDRFQAWYDAFRGVAQPATGPLHRALEVLIEMAVGLPGRPRSQDHLEAFVAEHLWFFLIEDYSIEDSIEVIEGPSLEVTDPGGDGLAVHRDSAGRLMFRLWEVKKHTGGSHISSATRKAYDQLEARAERYLSKISLTGQYASASRELQEFYGKLMDLWVEADQAAAAGISIGISQSTLPKRAFMKFPTRFPRLLTPPRLRGLIAASNDFPSFATSVRDGLWKGL
jgi:hypothetical protein